MRKTSLINQAEHYVFKKGDIIRFEMPSFTSGEYLAKVYHDPVYGFYIYSEHDFFNGCREWTAYNIYSDGCPDWLKKAYKDLYVAKEFEDVEEFLKYMADPSNVPGEVWWDEFSEETPYIRTIGHEGKLIRGELVSQSLFSGHAEHIKKYYREGMYVKL